MLLERSFKIERKKARRCEPKLDNLKSNTMKNKKERRRDGKDILSDVIQQICG